jgi:hypothetical protein
MKLQAPQGTNSISIAGENYEIAEDGTVEVSSTAAGRELCDTFGFTVAGTKVEPKAEKPPPDKFDDMSRAEIIGYLKSKQQAVVPATDTDTLRAQARAQYSPAERAADAAAAFDKAKG